MNNGSDNLNLHNAEENPAVSSPAPGAEAAASPAASAVPVQNEPAGPAEQSQASSHDYQAPPAQGQPYAGGQRYPNPPYGNFGASSYRPAPNAYVIGNSGYTAQNGYAAPQRPQTAYAPPAQKTAKGASKGFVVGMVCLGIVISLLLGVLAGAAYYRYLAHNDPPASSGEKNSVVIRYEETGDKVVITDKGDAAYVSSLVSDAVVEVTTETVSRDTFFGQYVTEGAGSGVIISSDDSGSYIITCAHVIEGATNVYDKLKDGTESFTSTSAASRPSRSVTFPKSS